MLRPLAAEALGTALLLAAVVGSGVMAERLSDGNMGVALLANAVATGAALHVLITVFGPVSGAHFNPVVSLVFALSGEMGRARLAAYIAVQIGAAVVGVWIAHVMFGEPVLQVSTRLRDGPGQALSEFVAAFGLILTILGALRSRPAAVPAAVALYVTAAYWFTASTAFANPAVTLARSLSDTFAGIAPASVPVFILAQLAGGLVALPVSRFLFARPVAA